MLLTLLKKEIREQVLGLRFLVLTVICLTLLPLSFFVSNRDYQNRVGDYNRLVQLGRDKTENVQMMELMSEAFSIEGYAPPAPLSVFALGLTGDSPGEFQSKRSGISFSRNTGEDKSILTLTGKMDFLFIVQVIFSLLAILFTFDAVCGEREQGTLKMMLSNPVPRDIVILGKLLGVLTAMVIPFVVAFLLGIAMLLLLGFPLDGGEMLVRIGGLMAGTVLFVAIFACIGLFVSARTERAKTAVIVLMMVWIMAINVIPKGATIIAQAFVPVESEEVVQIEKSMLRRDLELERGAAIERMESTLPQYLPSIPANAERNGEINTEREQMLKDVRDAYARDINDGLQRIDDNIQAKRDQLNMVAFLIARLSPVTSFSNFITNLAGTGQYDRVRFITAAKAHQDILDRNLFQHIQRDIGPSGTLSLSIDGDMIDMENLPAFTFERSSLIETASAVALDAGILILFLALSFSLAYVAFLKYDVR